MIPGAALPKLAECRTCHEPIRFVRMEATGRLMPINPAPVDTGTRIGQIAARLNGPQLFGYVIAHDRGPDAAHPLIFTPHWSVCEKPRKTPKAPSTEPDPALF